MDALISGGEPYRLCHELQLSREHLELESQHCRIQEEIASHLETMNQTHADREHTLLNLAASRQEAHVMRGQLDSIADRRKTLEEERRMMKVLVTKALSELNTRDITLNVNQSQPSVVTQALVKAVCLLQGVFPKVKGGSGLGDQRDYSLDDWWKTSQTFLMHRGLVRELKGFQSLEISSDILYKLKRECLPFLDLSCLELVKEKIRGKGQEEGEEEEQEQGGERGEKGGKQQEKGQKGGKQQEKGEDMLRLPQVTSRQKPTQSSLSPNANTATLKPKPQDKPNAETILRASQDTFHRILSTWIHGVHLEASGKVEVSDLEARELEYQKSLKLLETQIADLTLALRTLTRSVPARQSEMDTAVATEKRLEHALQVKARQRHVTELLNFTSSSGHTALSFAASVGGVGTIGRLVANGANVGPADEIKVEAANVLKFVLKHFVWKSRKRGKWTKDMTNRLGEFEFVFGLKFKVIRFRRLRQTRHVPLLEAAAAGYTDICQQLIAAGRCA